MEISSALAVVRELNRDASLIATSWERLTGKQIRNEFKPGHEFEHAADCTCGCHDHEHHHHHADEVFTSWGKETPHKFEKSKIEEILKGFVDSDNILRSKGMVESTDGSWIYFDMVPGEYEIREGEPDYTGRIVVIGTEIHEHELEELFGLA